MTTADSALALVGHAAAIHHLACGVVEDVIEIGRRLTEARAICGHGNWLPWLKREFRWSGQTALNFIHLYELSISDSKRVLDLSLPLRGLYLLAAPSTPEPARTEIIARAQAGEAIPNAEIERVIQDTKGRKQPARKPPIIDAEQLLRYAPKDIEPARRAAIERLREGERIRRQERETEQKLALQLIDIGYKALATKLHPDKGGSRDAMARLNQVRNDLRHGHRPPPPARTDIGETSTGKIGRLQARVGELETENRRLQHENAALRRRVTELEAAAPPADDDDGLGIPTFLRRSAP